MQNNRVYKTGEYVLVHPEKYKGTKKLVYKSSFEHRVFYWCDLNKNILEWDYEPFPINYLFMLPDNAPEHERNLTDKKEHKYWPDVVAKVKQSNGNVETFILEIKPYSQTVKPTEPKKKTKKSINKFLTALQEYLKNMKKWEYADIYAKKNGMIFQVLTERQIFS